jgi:hypothetical protein
LPFAPSRPQTVNEPTSSYFRVAQRPQCDIFIQLAEGSRAIALIRVVGLEDEASAAATIAALRTGDPNAAIKVDHQRGLIDITSEVPVRELCGVLHDAGFIAAPIKSTPGTWSARDTLRLLLRTILFALPGAFGGIIIGVGVGILNVVFNPECTSGGDEGACAMGIPLIAIGFAVLGGGITGGITLVRGGIRLHRAWRVSRQTTL